MSYVSIVVLSHSFDIVAGVRDLLKQVQPDVPLAIAGGLKNGELGTDVFAIKSAIESVYSPLGVVILFDLGSARLNAEMAIEMLEENQNIRLVDAPLVEGSYAAIIEAGCGADLEDVIAAAMTMKSWNKLSD